MLTADHERIACEEEEKLAEFSKKHLEEDKETLAIAERFGVPLWILTRPGEPHMQESPEELD